MENHIRYADVIRGIVSNFQNGIITAFSRKERAISIIDTARIKDDWPKNFLQVKQLITFDRSVMTYKIMNRLCPENLWNKFQRRSHHSNYLNLQIPKYNIEHSEKRFSYTALKDCNEIPMNLVSI